MGPAQEAQHTNRYRWVILVAACVIGFMTVGMRETLGNFLKTIITDLNWNYETISIIVAINLWLSGLLQPFTGHVMDRFGPKWLFVISVTLYGLGVGLMGFTQSVGYLTLVYGILLGSATAGASISLSNAVVAQWFPPHRRAFAISINNAAVALGRLGLVTVSYALLTLYSWRTSHMYLGALILIFTIPAALLLPQRRLASGKTPGAARPQPAIRGPLEVGQWHESLRSAPLWQLMGGYFVCGMTVNLSLFLIPFATDRGFLQADAVKAMSLMSVFSFLGSLLSGVVSDRIGRKNVLAVAYAVRALAFGVLLMWHSPLALFVFAALGGMSWLATPPSVMALTGEIYGMRTIGTLGGVSLLAHQIGGGASVWLAGRLRDLTGSYDISFTLAILALVGAALVSFIIAERRYSVRYVAQAAAPVGD